MSKQGKSSRHYVLTINNYTKEPSFYYNSALMAYLILGRETGEKTQTPHYQGYVCFETRKYRTGVKKLFPSAWFKVKRGTSKECIVYCKKEGNYEEFGTPPVSNTMANKRKWALARKAATTGDFESIPDDLYCRYVHNFIKIRQLNPISHDDNKSMDNYWIQGPTGNGKTKFVKLKYDSIYYKGPNKWWDGYQGEPTVLLDDIGPNECKFLSYYLKQWLHEYPFRVQTKGSSIMIRPRRIIVTSQYTIDESWPFDNGKLTSALKRRFKVLNLPHWSTTVYANLLKN